MPTEHDCIEKEKSETDDFCWLGVFTIVTKEKKKTKDLRRLGTLQTWRRKKATGKIQ